MEITPVSECGILESATKLQPLDFAINSQFDQLKISFPEPHSTLDKLPSETLQDIVMYLPNIDKVCLALTCKEVYNHVLGTAKSDTLKPICPSRPVPSITEFTRLYICYGRPDTDHLETDFEKLMNRLWLWMGPDYVWCGMPGTRIKAYIWRKDEHDETSRCGSLMSESVRQAEYFNIICARRFTAESYDEWSNEWWAAHNAKKQVYDRCSVQQRLWEERDAQEEREREEQRAKNKKREDNEP